MSEPRESRESEFALSLNDAMARLEIIPDYDCGNGPEACVHSLAQAGFGLLGAHWPVNSVRAFFWAHGVETAGDEAAASGHGLVTVANEGGRWRTVFFATSPDGGAV